MIRVAKSTDVPAKLTNEGILATAGNCRLYEANADDYNNGTTKFEIDSDIYGHPFVKQQLIAEQHGKCCFCEADFTANGYGDVEHFRPKAGFTKIRTGKLIRPGYYWLAYDWTNLFFSCQICNQRFKKNYFPIRDEAHRAKNHEDDSKQETHLLMHPSEDNPEDHITFNRHVPVGKDNRGKLSIAGFGIDRSELNRVREAYLQNVRNNIAFAKVNLSELTTTDKEEYSRIMNEPWPVLEDIIMKAKAFVILAARDTQPFSAMVRANFPDLI